MLPRYRKLGAVSTKVVKQPRKGALSRRGDASEDTACPHCKAQIAPKIWAKVGSRVMSRQRKQFGPVGDLRPCPHCGTEHSVRGMREHIPRCPRRPGLPLTPEQRERERLALGR